MKIMVKKYYEKLHACKFGNLDENEPLVKSHKLSNSPKRRKQFSAQPMRRRVTLEPKPKQIV